MVRNHKEWISNFKPSKIYPINSLELNDIWVEESEDDMINYYKIFEDREFENKSAIILNLELPSVSPHWPGVGKYVGFVDDNYYKTITPRMVDEYGPCFEHPWAKKRIYQDELDKFNGFTYYEH